VVSTALVSQAGLDGFRAAFTVICLTAVVGAVTAAVAFPRGRRPAPAEPAVIDARPGGIDPLVSIPVPADAHDRA
jgi:hypothetical protein